MGGLAGGDTVVVYDGDAVGLSNEARAEIKSGWPESKVVFSTPHPELAGKLLVRKRGQRRTK
jgi:hypothetical protein